MDKDFLKKRLADLSRRAYNSGSYSFTDFLSPSDAALAFETLETRKTNTSGATGAAHNTDNIKNVKLWGGAEGCERVMVRFGDPYELGYETDFPIKVLKFSPVNPKFAEDLSHRDYLGTLMNLGIERDTIGDIIIQDGVAYIFVADRISDYICENVTCIRHTNIKCGVYDNADIKIQQNFEEVRLIIPSHRLDAMIARLFNLSRNTAATLFAENKVMINGQVCVSGKTSLSEGDVIAVRGHGKFLFTGKDGETRKGNMIVIVNKYV